ncbi:MAG: DUF3124 domain-containing protein [Desulforhopalus sp.]
MTKQGSKSARFFFILILSLALLQASFLHASEPMAMTTGQTVYIPAYSHIYHGNKETPLLLSVTLSIRNIDPNNSLTVTTVNYHETEGPLVKEYIKEPVVLGPLGSKRYIVPQKDNTGGSGANFIVGWQAETPINPPIIESVMIGTQSQLGISFTSRGQAIRN